MKKIILTTLFSFITVTTSQAYELEARSVKELVTAIQNTKFIYKGRGKMFGYNSTESCLYGSKEMVILKNYCYPAKPYPAKSYTVISPKFGMIDFYEEDFGGDSEIKHDVHIETFPDILKDYFSASMDTETIGTINLNMKKMYEQFYPACWSTNSTYEEGQPDFGCYKATLDDVIGLQDWYDETQALTADGKSWNELLNTIEVSIKK